jgi:hypothetical protein
MAAAQVQGNALHLLVILVCQRSYIFLSRRDRPAAFFFSVTEGKISLLKQYPFDFNMLFQYN